MGLDMMFYAVPYNINIEDLSYNEKQKYEIAYFRKHEDLNTWLITEWLKTQPEGTDCEDMRYFKISEDTLDSIRDLCRDPEGYEDTHNITWGYSLYRDWKKTEDVCDKIQFCMDNGLDVYYYASW